MRDYISEIRWARFARLDQREILGDRSHDVACSGVTSRACTCACVLVSGAAEAAGLLQRAEASEAALLATRRDAEAAEAAAAAAAAAEAAEAAAGSAGRLTLALALA